MRRTMVVIGVLSLLCAWTLASGQSQPVRRIVGDRIDGGFQILGETGETVAVETLTFPGGAGRPAFTIEFSTRFPGLGRATSPPRVVDVIVTEHRTDDDSPTMSMYLNGTQLPLITRLRTRRSVATTVPFDEFERLTKAETLIYQAFDTDLELSPRLLALLRSTAERWGDR